MQLTLPIQTGTSHTIRDIGRTSTGKVCLAVGATAFVAMCAHISFPLYFSPVPVTLQTLAVILVGFILGPALGFSALALYLLEGVVGLPVFSPHGPGGVAQLAGPTGGFLFAYPVAAAVAGYIVRIASSSRFRFPVAIIAGCAASALILAIGTSWFGHLLHVRPAVAWQLACKPFIAGECGKIAVAAAAYASLYKWRRP